MLVGTYIRSSSSAYRKDNSCFGQLLVISPEQISKPSSCGCYNLLLDGLGGSFGCDWWSGGCGFDPCRVSYILLWRFVHKIFSTVILSLPLIQLMYWFHWGIAGCIIVKYQSRDRSDHARTWNVHKEGYIPHGKLRTFTCGGLRSIGTLCPQVYASWKFFLCGRPQYFHMQVRSCPQRGPRKSADISADIFADVYADVGMDWCVRRHGLVRTSAWIGADVRMDWCERPHGCVRMSADVRMDGCGHLQGQRIC